MNHIYKINLHLIHIIIFIFVTKIFKRLLKKIEVFEWFPTKPSSHIKYHSRSFLLPYVSYVTKYYFAKFIWNHFAQITRIPHLRLLVASEENLTSIYLDFWWWLINMFFSPYTWLLMMAYKYVRRHRNTGISHWMGNDRAHEMPKWGQRLQQEFDDLVGLDKKVHESDLDKFPYIPQMHHQRNTPTQLDSHRELSVFVTFFTPSGPLHTKPGR